MVGTLIFVLSMVGVVLFSYFFGIANGYAWGRWERRIYRRAAERIYEIDPERAKHIAEGWRIDQQMKNQQED